MTPIPPAIVQKLVALRRLIDTHLEVVVQYKQAHDNDIYTTDLWFDAAINRSLHLIEGFATMVEIRNAYCALALVRLQIDTATRLFAISRVANPDDFICRVLDGEQVNRLHDRDGKPMTDNNLVGLLSQDGREWLKRVYETTSGYVHMSGHHLSMMTTLDPEEEGAVYHHIGPVDENWPAASMAEAIDGFVAITELILTMAYEWWQRKSGLPPRPATVSWGPATPIADTDCDV
jgi:hypothetical protein